MRQQNNRPYRQLLINILVKSTYGLVFIDELNAVFLTYSKPISFQFDGVLGFWVVVCGDFESRRVQLMTNLQSDRDVQAVREDIL